MFIKLPQDFFSSTKKKLDSSHTNDTHLKTYIIYRWVCFLNDLIWRNICDLILFQCESSIGVIVILRHSLVYFYFLFSIYEENNAVLYCIFFCNQKIQIEISSDSYETKNTYYRSTLYVSKEREFNNRFSLFHFKTYLKE